MARDLSGKRVAILATDGDEQVVVDGQFTTSRSPADLHAFCPAIVEQFAGGRVPS
jgi:putative intracellular protease/amidase